MWLKSYVCNDYIVEPHVMSMHPSNFVQYTPLSLYFLNIFLFCFPPNTSTYPYEVFQPACVKLATSDTLTYRDKSFVQWPIYSGK